MRKNLIPGVILLLFISAMAASAQQTSTTVTPIPAAIAVIPTPVDAPVLTLTRMEICTNVEDRKPVGIKTNFAGDQDKVYCFLEFGGAKKETFVTVLWTLGQQEMGRVTLPVRRFPMFRTWANKTVSGMKGDWKVDVLDEKGISLKSAVFTVQ